MTYRRLIEDAEDEWAQANVTHSPGPERVHYDDQPDPDFKPHPVGFTATPPATAEPILWEGDNT